MSERKKIWLGRALAGGLAGMAVLYFVGGFFHGLVNGGLLGGTAFYAVSPDLVYLTGSRPLAAAVQFGLYFALGAGAGVATLPFAEDGKKLLVCSLLHFLYMAAVFSALVWLCWWNWNEWLPWLAELALMALLYVFIWLGRWAGWCAELNAIREKLGLAPVPSPLKWRESLPHVGFAALLCLGVPVLLRLFLSLILRVDDPSAYAIFILTPLALLASFPTGISLGKRQGFCPLYPAACGTFYFIALAALYSGPRRAPAPAQLVQAALVLAAALAGTLLGAAWRRVAGKRTV